MYALQGQEFSFIFAFLAHDKCYLNEWMSPLPFPFFPSSFFEEEVPICTGLQFCTGMWSFPTTSYIRLVSLFIVFSLFLSRLVSFSWPVKHACVSFVFKTPRSKYFKYLLPSVYSVPSHGKILEKLSMFSDPTSLPPTFTSHRKQFLDPIILNCCPVSFANIVSSFLESHSLPLPRLGSRP